MSHFTVGVLVDKKGKNLEELLATYQENNMGDCPKEYLEFQNCTDEVLKNFEEYKKEYKDLDTFVKDYYGYELSDEQLDSLLRLDLNK